jgi:CRP-like cAMP-binding protein
LAILIDEELAAANSRLTAIRLATLTLRLMENWRRRFDDHESLMVILAVVAITADRLTRSDLPSELRSLDRPFPTERLARCSISSIAAATGLNRETARRKVNELIEAGILVRRGREIGFTTGHVQDPYIGELIRSQLDAVTRLVNELHRDGVLKVK